MKKLIKYLSVIAISVSLMTSIKLFEVKAVGDVPVITLIGKDTIYSEVGTPYKEYGAAATDTEDGDISSSIVIDSSAVNINVPGTYTITYNVIDSDLNNAATVSRTYIITTQSSFIEQNFVDTNTTQRYYSTSYNILYGNLSLPDGSFVSYGSVAYNSTSSSLGNYSYPYLVRTNTNNEVIWERSTSYYSASYQERFSKVIYNSSDQIVAVGSAFAYPYGMIVRFNPSTGSLISNTTQTSFTARFNDITEYSTDQYAIHDNWNNYLFIYNGITYVRRISLSTIAPTNSLIDIDSFFDGNIIIKYISGNDTVIRSITPTGAINWSTTITNAIFQNIEIFEDKIFLLGNTSSLTSNQFDPSIGGQDGLVLVMDNLGIITDSKSYGGLSTDTINFGSVDNGKIVLKTSSNSASDGNSMASSNRGVLVINADDLNDYFSFSYNDEFSYVAGISINSDSQISIAGYSYNSSRYNRFPRVGLLSVSALSHGITDNSIDYGSDFNYTSGIYFTDKNDNIIQSFIDYHDTFLTTSVGYHDISYDITINTESEQKLLRASRRITVNPISSIQSGDIYNGQVLLNVQGGTITINGDPYSAYDNYNIPGNSTMTISGVNGYSLNIPFTVNLVTSGIEDGESYGLPVALTFSGGTATLNGNPYTSGTEITEKGNHTIVITGANGFTETINFTMLPTILNVSDGGVYTETINPNINAEQMTLNGNPYTNEPITNAGNYTLEITGVGGYTETLNFLIETIITGIEQDGVYDGSTAAQITKGSVTLNGNPYINDDAINMPGLNTLLVTGEGGYSKQVTFTVSLLFDHVQNGVYVGETTPYLSGGNITLNGNPYTSGTLINIPGDYNLTVNGVSGFTRTFIFRVNPLNVNVTAGTTYYTPRVVATSNGTLLLNGNPYTSGTILNQSGSYTLQIIGAGGYTSSVSFTMAAGSNIIDGSSYIEEVTINFIGDGSLNGSPISSGHYINHPGIYQLEIQDGLDTLIYDFEVVPNLEVYDNDIFLSHIINIPNTTLTLDGTSISNLHEITAVGQYSLLIEGVNGYSETVNFSVHPTVNVTNSTNYYSPFTLLASGGTITLNTEAFLESSEISLIGKYDLLITGENGYSQSITFNLLPDLSDLSDDFYVGSVTPIISHDNMTLNGNPYTSGTTMNGLGYNTLVILGENGLSYEVEFFIIPNDLGVEEGGIYQGSVTITSNDLTLEVNGLPFTSGQNATTLGENELVLTDSSLNTHTINFFVIPLIQNVEDGGSYVGSVTPIINHTPLYLNNQLYTSGTVIQQVGHHTLKLTGLNGYTHEISFTVIENPSAVQDGEIYSQTIIPNIPNTLSMTLNGNPYTNQSAISQAGNHVISIQGRNGYTSSISFTILPFISNVSDGGIYQTQVTPVIPNATLTLNGNPYTSGSVINAVGYHTLEISGVNGYTESIDFTVNPNIINVVDEGTYLSSSPIYPSISNATLELNGEPFISNTMVRNVGNYTLDIYGLNGYTQTITFTINYVISGVIQDTYYDQSVTPSIPYATLLLNGNPYVSGTTISTIGKHMISIQGVGGYTQNIEFFIRPFNYTGFAQDGTYTTSRTINVPNASGLELNGSEFVNGDTITQVGNYTLTVFGVNGYEMDFNFVLGHSNLGVIDGVTYTSPVLITAANATLQLNGNPFISGDIVSLLGHYELDIIGEGSYLETITFDIVPQNYSIINGSSYIYSALISFDHVDLELNDVAIPNDFEVFDVGHHTLKLSGEGGYEEVIQFTILPQITGVTNGGIYQEKITIQVPHATLELNGESISTGDSFDVVGHYSLSITGVFGYTETLTFTIDARIANINDGDTFIGEVTPQITTDYDIDLMLDNSMIEIELNGITYIPDTEILNVGNHQLSIIGINGYQKVVSFVIHPNISGVTDGLITTSSIEIIIPHANLILNEEMFESGSIIEWVGYYTLDILGMNGYEQSMSFTILPVIEGVSQNQISNDPLTPVVHHASLELNGVSYTSGTDISLVGHYELSILGAGGYIDIVNFTIQDVMSGFIDQTSYTTSITPIFLEANLLLNGEPFTSGTLIQTVGHHVIDVLGEGNYTNQYTFTILPTVSNLINQEIYDFQVTPVIPHAELLLNGLPYDSGTTIYEVGHHTLNIVGPNDFIQTYTFTVTERLFGFNHNETYNSVSIQYDDIQNVKVNGIDIVSSDNMFNKTGVYTVVVYGLGGYTNQYVFNIRTQVSGVEHQAEYSQSVTPIINSSQITLNGNPYASGTVITQIGHHILEITGVGGFVEMITFTIHPQVINLENQESYLGSVRPFINTVNLQLNGEPFVSGTLIKEVGHHELKITGLNQYEQTIHFTVQEVFAYSGEYIDNNFIEYFSIDIENATLLLNGSLYQAFTEINEIGNYQLSVNGKNGYSNTYQFSLHPNIHTLYNGATLSVGDSINIDGATELYLNGEIYQNASPIFTVGYMALTVIGVNNYNYTVNLTITPEIIGVEDSGIYNHSVHIEIPYLEGIKVNGASYINDFSLFTAGHYDIDIFGVNSYVHSIRITLEAGLIISQTSPTSSVSIQISNVVSTYLNGVYQASLTSVSTAGNHIVRVTGVNGYEKIETFTIEGYVNGVIDDSIYSNNVWLSGSNGQTLILNGSLIGANSNVSTVGHHTLKIIGVNGYAKDIYFTVTPTISIPDSSTHQGLITLSVSNYTTMRLNGSTISNGTITKAGHHILDIYGINDYHQTIEFTIDVVTDLIHKSVHTNSITFSVSDLVSIKINGITTISRTINQIGHHEVEFIGVGGYSKVIQVTIETDVIDFPSEVVTTDGISIPLSTYSAYLNGRLLTSPVNLNIPGHHTLQIVGRNGYQEFKTFTIKVDENFLVNDKTYVESAVFNIPSKAMYINGEIYVKNSIFNQIGHHTLLIEGENGYEETVTFTIQETKVLTNNHTYTSYPVINFPNASSILLNDEVVPNGTTVSRIGFHVVTVLGTNNYESTYAFTIKSNLAIEDEQTYSRPITIHHQEATIRINGRVITEDFTIEKHGKYHIEVIGLNGYTETYDIKYNSPELARTLTLAIPTTSLSLGGIGWILLRRRRVI